MPSDETTLTVDGQQLEGWQEVRVTRGIERMPSDFDLLVTERYPEVAAQVFARPGSECVVRIGGDPVVTGFIDRYSPSIEPRMHKVGLSGRGRCQDLVDCAADIRGSQLNAANAADLARQVAAVYGVTVVPPEGEQGPVIPQFNFIQSETSWDIIERVVRFAALLAYEDAQGRLVLSRAGDRRHASGFVEGRNVERAAVSFSIDQRFSEYRALISAVENLADIARATGGPNTYGQVAQVYDRGVARRRLRVIVSEQMQLGEFIAGQRAAWEMARRFGRSQAVTLTCDSWRDRAGRLWEPNWRVPIDLPSLKLPDREWVISEVTYRRGRDGTQADLVMMPKEAFTPEPAVLQPFDWQVAGALQQPAAPRTGQ